MIAVIPALIFGALLKKYIDAALGNLWVIAIVMVAGGVILIFIDKFFAKQKLLKTKSQIKRALLIKSHLSLVAFKYCLFYFLD